MTATSDYYDILYSTPTYGCPELEPLPTFTGPVLICGENLSLGAAIMTPANLGYEPSHYCPACDIPLWMIWSFDDMPYASCPDCGEEASQIDYCRTCDRPSCRNTGH